MYEFWVKYSNKITYAIMAIALCLIAISQCKCKPIDITDSTPTMNRVTMYWNTDSFIQDTVELSIPYKGTIHESYFRFQRENIDSKEPYIISIGTFSDTVSVFNGEITEITYEKQDIPCSSYRIYSEHAVKLHTKVIIYQF